jgi:hypothetical protein
VAGLIRGLWTRSKGTKPEQNQPLDIHSQSLHIPATMINITPQQLRKAANIQEKIQSLQKELGQLLGGRGETATTEAPKKKRKVSAAGLANIRAAQKTRWARIKAGKGPKKGKLSAQGIANIRAGVRKRMAGKLKPVQKPKRKISPAARARLSALAKARWAKAKEAGKSRL